MITAIITISILHFISAFVNYKYVQLRYFNKKGSWYGSKPGLEDLLIVFCPVINVCFSFFFLIEGWKEDRDESRLVKFFKPKSK